jgi:hypothetical protein
MVGFEMLNEPQRDLSPETAAAKLRSVSGTVHWRHTEHGEALEREDERAREGQIGAREAKKKKGPLALIRKLFARRAEAEAQVGMS